MNILKQVETVFIKKIFDYIFANISSWGISFYQKLYNSAFMAYLILAFGDVILRFAKNERERFNVSYVMQYNLTNYFIMQGNCLNSKTDL